MTSKTLVAALIAALLSLVPLASADNETAPEDRGNAWVENCPPDMMCAYSGGNAYGPSDCIECSGPVDSGKNDTGASDGPTHTGDCGGEVCVYDSPGEGKPVGNETDGRVYKGGDEEPAGESPGGTCMDGEQEGEVCDPNVYYMTPPKDTAAGPERESGAASDGESPAKTNATPGLGVGVAVLALGAVALLAARRRA